MSRLIFTILSIFCLVLAAAAANGNESISVYEAMKLYGFPPGLLPKGVTGYDLDNSTGKFNAYLNDSCSFSLRNSSYLLKYTPTISGEISKDNIRNLSGVSVKVVLLWLNVVGLVHKGNEIEFSVGIVSANFPIKNFDVCPQCGCGFNCNGFSRFRKIRMSSVSSS